MKRWLPLLVLGISACGQPAPPPLPDPVVPVQFESESKQAARQQAAGDVKQLPPGITLTTQVEVAKPTAQALQPKAAPLQDEKVKGPRSRSSDIERGDLPSPKPAATAVPLPVVKRKPTVPSPPSEGVSQRVGEGSEMNWRDVKFPESPAVKSPPRPEPTAADVPRLGYPVPDRIPVDDPTAEISTLRIVNTPILAPTIAAPFVRLLLPDPFEFAEHVKATPTAEFATLPVPVPMARP